MINLELAKEKGLIKESNDSLYHDIVKKYHYLLECFLSKEINFKKYELEIDNSNLYIGKNRKYKTLNEYLDLDYIFLISHLFVEKLSLEDINMLIEKFDKDNMQEELIEMVKRTYKDIIKDNYLDKKYTDDVYKVCYGYFVPTNFVDNDSLVFKIYYGKNLKEFNDKEFFDIHEKQLSFLNEIANKIIKEMKDKLDIKCEFLLEKDLYE